MSGVNGGAKAILGLDTISANKFNDFTPSISALRMAGSEGQTRLELTFVAKAQHIITLTPTFRPS